MPLVGAVAAQRHSLHAALHSDIHELLQKGGLHLILAVASPVLVIGVALCWHTLMQSQPPYGTSRALFLTTGFLPVHLFVEISSDFRVTANAGKGMRRYPAETTLDKVVVATLVNAVIYVAASFLGFLLLHQVYGTDVMPANVRWLLLTFAEMVLLGFGVGLCNVQIELFAPFWRTIYLAIGRALILFSGIFYVPALLPPQVRDIMSWNPVIQGVETFRFAFYPGYPQSMYAPLYFWSVAISAILLGLLMDRASRRIAQRRP